MVVVSLDHGSRLLQHINGTGRLAVNLLAEDQHEVALKCASKADDKFTGIGWSTGADGLPLIDGSAGWLSCRVDSQVQGGDHDILLCAVLDSAVPAPLPRPLIYGRRAFGTHSTLAGSQ